MLSTHIFTMARVTVFGAVSLLVASCDEGVALEPGEYDEQLEAEYDELEPIDAAATELDDAELAEAEIIQLDAESSFATEDATPWALIEPGLCLEDIEPDDIDFQTKGIIEAEAYCLAKCKGYKVYWLASEKPLPIGDWKSKYECEDKAKKFCAYNFSKSLKDSCLGLPKSLL